MAGTASGRQHASMMSSRVRADVLLTTYRLLLKHHMPEPSFLSTFKQISQIPRSDISLSGVVRHADGIQARLLTQREIVKIWSCISTTLGESNTRLHASSAVNRE